MKDDEGSKMMVLGGLVTVTTCKSLLLMTVAEPGHLAVKIETRTHLINPDLKKFILPHFNRFLYSYMSIYTRIYIYISEFFYL